MPQLAPARKPRGKKAASVDRSNLLDFFDTTLNAQAFSDYCPNGLQVQGPQRITTLVSGVTASMRLINAAGRAGAQAILVHHGYFWRGEDPRLTGIKHQRIARLINAGINLYAYHLPLDAHPALGNNAQLAQLLGWPVHGRCADNDLVFYTDLPRAGTVRSVASRLAQRLGRKPLSIGEPTRKLTRIAWCTGAAQDYIEAALAIGADAFISGEVSERTTHIAREGGIAYFAAGHHATEKYGVQALGAAAAEQFGLVHRFIDDPNPV